MTFWRSQFSLLFDGPLTFAQDTSSSTHGLDIKEKHFRFFFLWLSLPPVDGQASVEENRELETLFCDLTRLLKKEKEYSCDYDSSI